MFEKGRYTYFSMINVMVLLVVLRWDTYRQVNADEKKKEKKRKERKEDRWIAR